MSENGYQVKSQDGFDRVRIRGRGRGRCLAVVSLELFEVIQRMKAEQFKSVAEKPEINKNNILKQRSVNSGRIMLQ